MERLALLKTWQHCRVCGSPLLSLIDLGEQYIAGYVKDNIRLKFSSRKVSLHLCRCDQEHSPNACGLVQLKHTTPSFLLYRDYFYRSAVNDAMVKHLYALADDALSCFKNNKDELVVVDIGANDGTMLKHVYKQTGGAKCIAFEPARNLKECYDDHEIDLVNDFFSAHLFRDRSATKAHLIFSIAMFYDLENPIAFAQGIKDILHQDGIWVLEQSYLPLMLKNNAFDTITHEHITYYSLAALEHIFDQCDLKVIDARLNEVNGGSIRLYVSHKRKDTKANDDYLSSLRLNEFEMMLDTPHPYVTFEKRVRDNCDNLRKFVEQKSAEGKKVFAYGASTKGVVTLQACGLDNSLIEACADRNPTKWGLKIGGLNIPIISEEEARAQHPDYFLLLPWHFLPSCLEREKDFLSRGGKFIVPMPKFEIIS